MRRAEPAGRFGALELGGAEAPFDEAVVDQAVHRGVELVERLRFAREAAARLDLAPRELRGAEAHVGQPRAAAGST